MSFAPVSYHVPTNASPLRNEWMKRNFGITAGTKISGTRSSNPMSRLNSLAITPILAYSRTKPSNWVGSSSVTPKWIGGVEDAQHIVVGPKRFCKVFPRMHGSVRGYKLL